jgi:hypothetical protein
VQTWSLLPAGGKEIKKKEEQEEEEKDGWHWPAALRSKLQD